MAKRFIDTGMFDDEWFSDLSKDGKILWMYYLSKCDNAGILKFNKKLIEFQTGVKSIDTVLIELGNRLVRVSEQLFFCPKFLSFQYPKFPQSNAPQEKQVIGILEKHGLWDNEKNELRYSIDTLSIELPNSYGNGKGNGNGNGEGKIKEVSEKKNEPEQDYEIVEHPYINKIKNEFPVLLKMKHPLTEKEAEKLYRDFGDEVVFEKLEAMANKADILKKYTSTNLTIRSWVKYTKNHGKPTTEPEKKFGRVSERSLRDYGKDPIVIIPD